MFPLRCQVGSALVLTFTGCVVVSLSSCWKLPKNPAKKTKHNTNKATKHYQNNTHVKYNCVFNELYICYTFADNEHPTNTHHMICIFIESLQRPPSRAPPHGAFRSLQHGNRINTYRWHFNIIENTLNLTVISNDYWRRPRAIHRRTPQTSGKK